MPGGGAGAVAGARLLCWPAASATRAPMQDYGRKATKTVEVAESSVQTVLLTVDVIEQDGAFGPYLGRVIGQAEEDAAAALEQHFGVVQPPSTDADAVRAEVNGLVSDTVDLLAEARIAIRRSDADTVPPTTAAPLEDTLAALGGSPRRTREEALRGLLGDPHRDRRVRRHRRPRRQRRDRRPLRVGLAWVVRRRRRRHLRLRRDGGRVAAVTGRGRCSTSSASGSGPRVGARQPRRRRSSSTSSRSPPRSPASRSRSSSATGVNYLLWIPLVGVARVARDLAGAVRDDGARLRAARARAGGVRRRGVAARPRLGRRSWHGATHPTVPDGRGRTRRTGSTPSRCSARR